MNWQKAGAIVGLLVGVLAVGSSAVGGVRYVFNLETRISEVEKSQKWRDGVEERLETVERWGKVSRNRWAKHFDLWGDAIERRTRELEEDVAR